MTSAREKAREGQSIGERANAIAEKANECCSRSDGYEEEIYALIIDALLAIERKTIERCAKWHDNQAEIFAGTIDGEDDADAHRGCAAALRALQRKE